MVLGERFEVQPIADARAGEAARGNSHSSGEFDRAIATSEPSSPNASPGLDGQKLRLPLTAFHHRRAKNRFEVPFPGRQSTHQCLQLFVVREVFDSGVCTGSTEPGGDDGELSSFPIDEPRYQGIILRLLIAALARGYLPDASLRVLPVKDAQFTIRLTSPVFHLEP